MFSLKVYFPSDLWPWALELIFKWNVSFYLMCSNYDHLFSCACTGPLPTVVKPVLKFRSMQCKKIAMLLEAEEKQVKNIDGTIKLLLIARLSLIETPTFISNMILSVALFSKRRFLVEKTNIDIPSSYAYEYFGGKCFQQCSRILSFFQMV